MSLIRRAPSLGNEGPRPLVGVLDRTVSLPLVQRSTAVWLVAIVGASALLRAVLSLTVPSVWILPDEVVYSELAKSIADGARPSIRGMPVFGWGEVYPTLIAPAWALVGDPVRAYHTALAINALVMSLAAVPAYLLARLFVPRRAALLVGLLTVLVPSMSYTGVVMTENAFYPVFLLAVLLIARAVRAPTTASQAFALLGLVLVAFTRIQGVALVAAYVLAVGIYAMTGAPADCRHYLARFRPTAVAILLASVTPIAASVARGDGPLGWLGARSGTFEGFHAREIPEWFAFLAADLSLYVAVAPLVATVVMIVIGLSRHASEPLRLFAAVALSTFLAMLTSVSLVSASLDVDGVENLNERYLFYVVPLAFVGLACWVEAQLPRPKPVVWPVLLACCLLPALIPFDRLEYNANFQSVALLPWIGLAFLGPAVPVAVAAFTLACGLVWLRARVESAGRVWLVTALSMVLVGMLAVGVTTDPAANAATTFEGQSATWIDDALPDGATASVVWKERLAPKHRLDLFAPWVMVAEFFNPAVGDVYRLGPPTYYERFLQTIPVSLGPDRTLLLYGRPLDLRFALVTCQTPVVGTVIARAPHSALELVRVEGHVRLTGANRCPTGR